ncbi:MAG: prolipoprotein diacylglyceryl transferase [Alphaproteobacteria bacterium]|nr:prolipoprotein diacylglyceryl transferase [Alphaproteobacteria bacterium]
MWPTLFETPGGLGAHTYGLMVLMGLVAGQLLVLARAPESGIPFERVLLACGVAIPGGLIGARLLYVVGAGDLAALTSTSGGLAWYGGVVGGALAVLAVPSLRREAWTLADLVAPALALGATLGRLGCFFAGCCHGVPVQGAGPATPLLAPGTLHGQIYTHPHFPFLSLSFTDGAARIHDVPLYPTQLWQSAGSLLILFVLLTVGRLRRFEGQVMATFLLLEPPLRTVVEAYRGDQRGFVVSWPAASVPSWLHGLAGAAGADEAAQVVGLTTSQAIALAMMALGVAILVLRPGPPVVARETTPVYDDLVD